MIPPFASHPLVSRFNELKRFFRRYETGESRHRVREFRQYAKMIDDAGFPVAFDFLGSVNFGQAVSGSDVDLVVYLKCEVFEDEACDPGRCLRLASVERLMIGSLIHLYEDSPYSIQVVDCINLDRLSRDIKEKRSDSPLLIRFAFYRSVCRLVNPRLIRPYHISLVENPELMGELEPNLNAIFDILAKNSRHNNSLRKYQERIRELGVDIPEAIIHKIRTHLNESASHAS